MGIDLKAGGRNTSVKKTTTKSTNLYLHILVRLYNFLARRTDSDFCKTIAKRLLHSNVQKAPVSVSRLATLLKGSDKLAVVVGPVTDDNRLLDLPKINVCALRVTDSARARITKAGGRIMTFDELALENPTGKDTLLLRGRKDREAKKHFGKAPGTPHSHTKPYAKKSEAKQ